MSASCGGKKIPSTNHYPGQRRTPSSKRNFLVKVGSKIWPEKIAKSLSQNDGLRRANSEEVKRLSGRGVRSLSVRELRGMSQDQLKAVNPRHTRNLSSGRQAYFIPVRSVDEIINLLKQKRYKTFDELYTIGEKLSGKQRTALFGSFVSEIFDREDLFSEALLRGVSLFKDHLIPLMVVMAGAKAEDPKKNGELLVAMTNEQRERVMGLVKSTERAYAIEKLPVEDAIPLYKCLSRYWRCKIDQFLSENRKKELYPAWVGYWAKVDIRQLSDHDSDA